MDSLKEAKKLIEGAKNVYILPGTDNQNENISNSLALFYTLKKLNKNVNLVVEEIPEKLHFLIPSLNFLSYPKDFVISVPAKTSEISQVRYDKTENELKIYLTLDKGNIKKNDISFSFFSCKPDLLITIGFGELKDVSGLCREDKEFLDDVTILNIDNQAGNKQFGKVNIIKSGSLSELVFNLIKSIDENLFDKNIANCLLTGLIIFSESFLNIKTSSETFETAAFLIKKGASYQETIQYLHKPGFLPSSGPDLNFIKNKIFEILK